MPLTPLKSLKPNPKTQWNVGYWLLALLALLWIQEIWQTQRTVEPVPYSAFEQALAEGRVSEVVIGETTITGKLKQPDGRKRGNGFRPLLTTDPYAECYR